MKIKKTLLFIIITIVISLSFFLIAPITKASMADITYTFERDIIYDDPISYNQSFNIGNPIDYSENYTGSYFYENDTTGNIPIGFSVFEVGGTFRIIENIEGHNKVLELHDTGASNTYGLYEFPETSFGTFEFWIRTTDISKDIVLRVWDGVYPTGDFPFLLGITGNLFKYYDGAWKTIPNAPSPLPNTWYHIKDDFECTGTGYEGLAQYQHFITVNGIKSTALTFHDNVPHINLLEIYTGSAPENYYGYFDGFGGTWNSNFTIGTNIIPEFEIDTSIQQVERFEFAFEGLNDIVDFGDDNVQGFVDVESAGDNVNPVIIGLPAENDITDKGIGILVENTLDYAGIVKSDIGLTNKIINVSFEFIIATFEGTTPIQFQLYDSSDDRILTLVIMSSGHLYYQNGADFYNDYAELLNEGWLIGRMYDINIFINYNNDLATIRLYDAENYNNTFHIPLLESGHVGLSKVNITTVSTVGNPDVLFAIDSVGIFADGVSIANSHALGFVSIPLNIPTWNVRDNNLFSMNATGSFYLGFVHGAYFISETYQSIHDYYTHTSYYIDNLYSEFVSVINNPTLIITLNQSSYIDITYIAVEGVDLILDSIAYPLIYSYSGVSSNESYFYVDNFNKLQFTYTANDTNLEYIQAEFNIPDISSSDYAIKYRSRIDDNKADGYFRVNFTAISNFIPLTVIDSITRLFISQNKTITSFVILITDDDVDSITGITTGFVSEVQLLYVAGISVSITTSSLLVLLIPIIMTFIPTFILTQGTKYKNMIVPLMMLMSTILVINEIIPYWLFFIIVFPSILFLFLKKDEGFI